MTDTISNDDGAQWPVLDRPSYGGRFRGLTGASRTTAMTAAVSLVLVGGVATATVRSLGPGADPAQVVPASAFAIAQIDLSLPDGQDSALEHLVDRFPGAPKGSGSLRDRLLGALFGKSTDPHVNYRTSVQPWLGDHAAVAGWVDSSGKPQAEYVIQSTDDAAARKAIHAISPTDGISFSHGFAIVTSTQQLADATVRAADRASLADDPTYSADLGALDGGTPVASGWLDGPAAAKAITHAMSDLPDGADMLSSTGLTKGMTGRVVAGLWVHDDGDNSAVQLDIVGRGATKKSPTTTTERLRSLPEATFAALTIGDPSGVVRDATNVLAGPLGFFLGGFSAGESCTFSSQVTITPNTAPGLVPTSPTDPAQPPPGMSECTDTGPPPDAPTGPLGILSQATGLNLPDDLESLLGSDAVVSFGGLGSGGVPKIGLRSKPNDVNAAADVVTKLRNKLSGSGVDLAERANGGDFVVATTDEYADELQRAGTLGKVDRFDDAMRGMPSAVGFAAYLDLGAILPLATRGKAPQLDHLTAFGMWTGDVNGTATARMRLIIH
jgi:hypothetical protein